MLGYASFHFEKFVLDGKGKATKQPLSRRVVKQFNNIRSRYRISQPVAKNRSPNRPCSCYLTTMLTSLPGTRNDFTTVFPSIDAITRGSAIAVAMTSCSLASGEIWILVRTLPLI